MKNLNRILKAVFAVLICSALSNAEIVILSRNLTEKYLPSSVVSENRGIEDGILACWYDEIDNGSLFVQKISNSGNFFWTNGGKQVDFNLGEIYSEEAGFPEIFSDGEGGAVIIYRKTDNTTDEIYFTRILKDGSIPGKPICISSEYGGHNFSHTSVKCNDNSIITAWENFTEGDFDIQAQKIDMKGNKLWNKGRELTVCGEPDDQRKPVVLCSENHVYFSWLDTRSSREEFGFSLYANKIDLNGNYTDFKDAGKLILRHVQQDQQGNPGTEKIFFYNHNMVLSSKNSFITAIEKQILDMDSYIKVIKVDENLDVSWEYDIDERSYQSMPLISSDGYRGACIFWMDSRNETSSVYGIRLSPNGKVLTGEENGTDLSGQSEKSSFKKELPSANLNNGIATNRNNLFLPWTSGEYGRLHLTTVDLQQNNVFKQSSELIQEYSSGGKYASVVLAGGKTVLVFQNNYNIYANIDTEQDFAKKEETEKINSYNFPNPFNPSTKINYNVPISAHVKIRVFNQAGQQVSELLNEYMSRGKYEVEFDAGKNNAGIILPSGVYFYKIEIVPDEKSKLIMPETGRMLLIK